MKMRKNLWMLIPHYGGGGGNEGGGYGGDDLDKD